MAKLHLRRIITVPLIYFLLIVGIFVLQFTQGKAFTYTNGALSVSGSYIQEEDGSQSLGLPLHLVYKGLDMYIEDSSPVQLVVNQNKKNVVLEDLENLENGFKLDFSENSSISFTSQKRGDVDVLSIAAQIPLNANALMMSYKTINSAKQEKKDAMLLVSSDKQQFVFSGLVNPDEKMLTFTASSPSIGYRTYVPAKGIEIENLVNVPMASQEIYIASIEKYATTSLATIRSALNGSYSEEDVSVFVSAQKNDEASALVEQILLNNPNDVDAKYLQAAIFNAKGETANYEKKLKEILSIDPNHAEALSDMGFLSYSKRNWNLAGSYFSKSLKVEPNNANTLYGLARVQYRTDKMEESEKTLDTVLQLDPYNDLAWADRAKVKFETNRIQEAITDINKAIELVPTDYYYWYDLGRFYMKLNKKAESIDAFTHSIDNNPDYYLSYVYRGGLNDLSGNIDEAISDYKSVIKLFPDYYFANESLAILQYHKKNYADAYKNFYSAYRRNPNNSSYILMCADCMYKENMPQKEIKKILAPALKTVERQSLEFYVLRLFNDNTGDNDIIYNLQKEESKENKSKALFYLALYYENKGKEELAQKYYLEAKSSIIVPSFFEYRLIEWAIKDAGV